jgi:deazaflavin-dependent oxidoreductase (nitroreductase family)
VVRKPGALHFLTPLWRRPQRAFVAVFRRYFARAPDWLVLTTRGRRTGLPREVLLPCRRVEDGVIVLSAYGHRSDWIRNLLASPRGRITCAGRLRDVRAEVIEERAQKRALLWKDPFLLPMPFAIVQALAWTILRPLYFALAWPIVASRPLVLLRPCDGEPDGNRTAGEAVR